jgi:dihydrofolate reductase
MYIPQAPVVIVVGMSRYDRAIGNKNGLLWHVPADMKRFKALTMGHPVIMGRKTFESILTILGKPLPGRTNIVVTRDTTYAHEDVKVTHSLEEAFEIADSESPTEIHIGGGAELYTQALPFVNRLHITWYHGQKPADTFFPDFESQFTTTVAHNTEKHEGLSFQWVDYARKK